MVLFSNFNKDIRGMYLYNLVVFLLLVRANKILSFCAGELEVLYMCKSEAHP